MGKFFAYIKKMYFNKELDFRVQIFNVFALGGIAVSFVMTTHALLIASSDIDIMIKFLSGVFSLTMLLYCNHGKHERRYQFCYSVSIFAVFIIFFTLMFFTGGGYNSGMPLFFVFAVVFTACMLDGKLSLYMILFELVWYSVLCIFAYSFPEYISGQVQGVLFLIDILICFLASGIAVAVTTYSQVSLYKAQQAVLDEKNKLLAEINQSKSEFLAITSHEMRTPLTVVSVNIQTAIGVLRHSNNKEATDEEINNLLFDAQNEIMRLSRLVGGMLSINSIVGNNEREKIDLANLIFSVADMLQLVLDQNNNKINLDTNDNLLVYCNPDLISQVIMNIIQNANKHTKNDIVTISAAMADGQVTVKISDNGCGIPPDLLPSVFDRGVTQGGTGYGLYLCKTIIESHGGSIWANSVFGTSTTIFFALPIYQGQEEKVVI